MEQAVEAVFENGIFRVIEPSVLHIPEGQKVKLMVEETVQPGRQDSLELLTTMYDGLSEQEIDEIERIILDRRDFFGRDVQ
ncbi:MAG: antitoxin family protein [Blastocatellia bacterium]